MELSAVGMNSKNAGRTTVKEAERLKKNVKKRRESSGEEKGSKGGEASLEST